jgi:hypothetical protein
MARRRCAHARLSHAADASVGPTTLDLGPEPPAVANFLVHGFRVTDEAVPATPSGSVASRGTAF